MKKKTIIYMSSVLTLILSLQCVAESLNKSLLTNNSFAPVPHTLYVGFNPMFAVTDGTVKVKITPSHFSRGEEVKPVYEGDAMRVRPLEMQIVNNNPSPFPIISALSLAGYKGFVRPLSFRINYVVIKEEKGKLPKNYASGYFTCEANPSADRYATCKDLNENPGEEGTGLIKIDTRAKCDAGAKICEVLVTMQSKELIANKA